MQNSKEKKYYWLKFQSDFFKSLRIKKLRKLAGGDTFTIIYLKLQLLALKTEGYLEYKGIFDCFEEEMAEEIEEDVENIRVTIAYLLSCGLMEESNGTYFLPYVEENTGSETKDAIRKRISRNEQKNGQLADNLRTMSGQCPPCVGQCPTEKEIEKEKEIDKDKEYIVDIVNYLNLVCGTNYRSSSEATKRLIKARLHEGFTYEDFKTVIDKKYADWGRDKNMSQYLRPQTLFGTKFESYLNQSVASENDSISNEPISDEDWLRMMQGRK